MSSPSPSEEFDNPLRTPTPTSTPTPRGAAALPKPLTPADQFFGLDLEDGEKRRAQLKAIFDALDDDQSGTLDKDEVRQAYEKLGTTMSPEQLDKMWDRFVLEHIGQIDFEEFASYFETNHVAKAQKRARRTRRISGAPQGLKSMLSQEGKKVRAVQPESIFAVSADSAVGIASRAELMTKIHELFEGDFHHLEDSLIMRENAVHYADSWEDAAREGFDEDALLEQMGWPKEFFWACKKTIKTALDDKLQHNRDTELFSAASRVKAVSIRSFVKEQAALAATEPERKANLQEVVRSAREYVQEGHHELSGLLDEEILTRDEAVKVIISSLKEEASVRKSKIDSLTERVTAVGPAPRRIKVSGLRNDSSLANGVYIADGLRSCWGRPLYVQQRDEHDENPSYFLYYDMRHDSDTQEWTDGVWLIGPTMNADLCTAYIREASEEDGSTHEMLTPATTAAVRSVAQGWETFDVVKKMWRPAPGDHCPAFVVEASGRETMGDYIGGAVSQQSKMLELISRRIDDESFAATLEQSLDQYAKQEHRARGTEQQQQRDMVKRKHYMLWMARFHSDELKTLQSALCARIMAANDAGKLQLPVENDAVDNRVLVSGIIQDFVYACDQKSKQRRVDRKRFLVRINRPAMSKAFHSWKMASQKQSKSGKLKATVFAEPQLPWNVRHPNSRVTGLWESAQAVLLIYVAFTVPFWVCFNIELVRWESKWWFDLFVDLFFLADIFLNMHTAYWDKSGELRGVTQGGAGQGPVADLEAMYRHYARGWMAIDVVSVFPFLLISDLVWGDENTSDSSRHQKALKSIRLLRLWKLLRLARGLRVFRKHRQKMGPLLKALFLTGTTALLLHIVTCVWFLLGTTREYSLDPLLDAGLDTGVHQAGSKDVLSTGWIEELFRNSDELCNCNQSVGEKVYVAGDTYYDPFLRECLSKTNEDDPAAPPCSTVSLDFYGYYITALFTIFRNPRVSDGYSMSAQEMIFGVFATMVMGIVFGAVAGTFASIFAPNAAAQAYQMKMKQLQEFARAKGLNESTKHKLQAHYTHLYPDKIIIDETEILQELPPQMREELVAQLYGQQLCSVPLFLNIESNVLTELCLALVPLPALRGSIMVKEGAKATHMFCIATGTVKVTERTTGGDDVNRVRAWVEEVFQSAGREVILIEPDRRQQIEALIHHIKRVSKEQARHRRKLAMKMEGMNETLRFKLQVDTTKLQAVRVDSNGDGAMDAWGYDTNGDGTLDAFDTVGDGKINALDTSGDGRLDAIDTTGDGKLDSFDTSGDGKVDSRDTTGDGKIDSVDANGDGNFDPWNTGDTQLDPQGDSIEIDSPLGNTLTITPIDEVDDDDDERSLSPVARRELAAVAFKDLLYDEDINDMAFKAGTTLESLLRVAKRRGRISFEGELALSTANRNGPRIVAMHELGDEERPVEKLCEALQSGELLLDLLEILAPSYTMNEDGLKVKSTTKGQAERNLDKFIDAVLDPQGPFHLAPDVICAAGDLLKYNKGPVQQRHERQRRVLSCLLELGFAATHMEGYGGPRIGDANLGNLGPGEFFGELSLLPLAGGWRHRRTVTVVSNAMLHSLSKLDVERIAARFPELKQRMFDHAEDFEKAEAARAAVRFLLFFCKRSNGP